MKKALLVLSIVLFGAAVATAQPSKEDQQKSKAEWEKKFKDELKLTEDQTAKFDAINKDYGAKIEAIAQDATLAKEVQKEKKMALKKEKESKILEILTPEQQTRYKELMEKKKKDMPTKQPGA
jgi:Spy/CpxP family protein refolding chaperone